MKFLRGILDRQRPHFEKGGKLEKLFPLFEMGDTFLYSPGEVTEKASHVRDGMNTKHLMIGVAIALLPVMIMALYNTGLQANLAMLRMGVDSTSGWRGGIIDAIGMGYSPTNIGANLIHGAMYVLPIFLVCNLVGGFWEALFSLVRGHEINEGFLVTGALFPLILPATIPLWQVAIGISFGVVIGKEIFGGTGRNFLNPALTGRAFLFFAYPAQISCCSKGNEWNCEYNNLDGCFFRFYSRLHWGNLHFSLLVRTRIFAPYEGGFMAGYSLCFNRGSWDDASF